MPQAQRKWSQTLWERALWGRTRAGSQPLALSVRTSVCLSVCPQGIHCCCLAHTELVTGLKGPQEPQALQTTWMSVVINSFGHCKGRRSFYSGDSFYVLELLCSLIKSNFLKGAPVPWQSAKSLWQAGG